ncbi:MAG: ParB/RepB/Spo0J family partition protein [Clostridia bacterium]|nr:ParB/RepB/Spo0J family partition protein [Clostridia bacterium]
MAVFPVTVSGGGTAERNKGLKEIAITKLKPFEGHPYKVIDNEEMTALVDSIREHGVMTPLIVRPIIDGYEIISGHRRAHAAEQAGLTTVSAIEMDLSRDEAAVMLVDSNLHREHILPSEKAFAYKLKAEALEHQGKNLTSGQLVPKSDGSRTTAVIGAQTGESYKTVQRYIRLTHLLPALLEMVDAQRIAFSVGVELSFLDPELQAALITAIEVNDCTPSYAQANRMHKAAVAGELDEDMLFAIMEEEKPNQREKVSISTDELRRYIPNATPSEMQAFVRKACEHYSAFLKKNREEVR